VGQVQIGGASIVADADGGHQVEPQEGQVDQVVAAQRLVAQVGVDQPQAAEAAASSAQASHLGEHDARGVSDEHVLDVAAPGDQHPHLTLDLARHAAQVCAELGGHHLGRGDAPPVDALERLEGAWLEACAVAGYLHRRTVSLPPEGAG
jgi:hypothetical protein